MSAHAATDWPSVPLQGRLLVEASAGSGKTWTIAALYLRLLLEGSAGSKPLAPERIVVATYTEAAAQELGERLRARVTQSLYAAQQAGWSADPADPIATWLAARWQDRAIRAADQQRLLAALAQFDRAPASTLHGLCQRLLAEHPLDGGQGFAAPTLGDGRRVHEAIARDLLRRIGAGAAPPHARVLPSRALRFEALVATIRFLLQPGAVVAPAPDDEALRGLVASDTQRALRVLADPGHYKQPKARALKSAGALLAFLESGAAAPQDIDALCGGHGVNGWVGETAARVLHDAGFQQAMAVFAERLARRGSAERVFWGAWATELRRLRETSSAELGELGFDALIERACSAMVAPGSALPDAAFARWPVALVDEFQDTDGTQYALLDRWYRDGAGQPRGLLAMVGDPKQAIYGFRGGDVQAYLRAQSQASSTLRLGINQRSSSTYVEACNAFFAGERAVLSADPTHAIRYIGVEAAGRADAARLHEHGVPLARPLVIHQHATADWNAIARPQAIAACADLVVALLEPGRYTLGADGRALAPGDLAVLLCTNSEIDALRRALHERGVPCAGQSRQQVFGGATARDLLLVLHALQHPGEAGALRAALLTPLFGVPLAAMAGADADSWLDDWRERFLGWRERWRREGVLAAVLAVLDAARPALAAHPERERILTDLRHLGELLQADEGQGHAPAALLDRLRAERADPEGGNDAAGERSLRLESDARRVRLMTLHAAKGLEFPVVLLPTLWGHETRRSSGMAFAPADATGQREVLFESAALQGLASAAQEERFRLLYVALTRAVQACHLFVLPPDRPARKPPARAKSPPKPKTDPERSALDAVLARWPEAERAAAAAIDWRPHWPRPPHTPFDPAAHAEATASAAVRTMPPVPLDRFALPTRWSFSRLVDGHEARDLDATAADDSDLDWALAELAEVGDAPFGNALHALLERMVPNQRYAAQLAEVQAVLVRHAVRIRGTTPMPVIAARVAALLDRVLATAIDLPGHHRPLQLGALSAGQRRHELAFHFVLRDASLHALRAACAAHGEPTLVPPGGIDRLSGWMEGAIDLVFEHGGRVHVLDWKSNRLANAAAATPGALVARMDAHHYRFQALLYSVALHRLLRQRLGARYRIAEHLGAPVYLFLRAVGLAPGLGVWSQDFPAPLIEAVDGALAGVRP